ncbi:glycosyltransferase [Francisella sp. 19X1-34]|uniref:glycosyltransferase n=1 Tax=Francisella sp. 19X1-34 TaxID=3087177 RepID=UPI002E36DDDB|nr:glycosyltransferase [Francisella sp. 19X1-34]MED7787526.1 glycosyltransferase [Francisella sp. 19X1-34]
MDSFLNSSGFRSLIKQGSLVINTVFGGGAYTYLLNQSFKEPLLIVDARERFEGFIATKCLFVTDQQVKEYYSIDLLEVISKMSNKYISINHLIESSDMYGWIKLIYDLKVTTNCDIHVNVHDYYFVCPTVNLLNYEMKFCDLPDEATCNDCLDKYKNFGNEIDTSTFEVRSAYKRGIKGINEWREIWKKLFSRASKITFPSFDTKCRYLSVYDIEKDKVRVLSHDLSYLSKVKKHSQVDMGFRVSFNVFIIGHIGVSKGSKIIYEVLKMIQSHRVPIYINVIGTCVDSKLEESPFLVKHGEFNHDNIHDVLNNMSIDCFIMPSICPETFSYATQEMVATGLPVISFNIGAQSDFVSKYENGIVLDDISPEQMFNTIYIQYKEKLLKQNNSLGSNDHTLSELLELCNKQMVDNSILAFDNNKLLEKSKIHDSTNKTLNFEIVELKTELACLEEEFNGVKNSVSWRVTRPFRVVFRFVTKFFKKRY